MTRSALLPGFLCVALACTPRATSTSAGGAPGRTATTSASPTLVLLITVDQMRPEYFERFGPQLTGGLARLARGGAVFTNAFQDHAITETAPGHSVTLSGRFPRSTGIVMNSLGVEDSASPLIGAPGPGASPKRFRGTSLIDWMIAQDAHSRALSVSMKDRGAILPLGRARQTVYWLAPDGEFVTSSWYAQTVPDWVRIFNEREAPEHLAGRAWEPLLPASSYPEPDSVPIEAGRQGFTFPHILPSDSAAAAGAFRATPWIDSLTLAFALDGVRALALGASAHPDLLAVSLSGTDVIGHRYGPDSKEIHDQILRLDRYLGVFLDSLFRLRDSTRVIIALTADHGVAQFPELAHTNPPARHVVLLPAVNAAAAAMSRLGVNPNAIDMENGALFLDRRAFARPALIDTVVSAFTTVALATPGVMRVDRVASLARADTVNDAIARRWLHMIPDGLPIEVVVTLTPGSVWGNLPIAMHGTPHDYDAHVPLIFFGGPFAVGRYGSFARVVDLAPTLAQVLGVRPLERLDGHALAEAIR